MTLDELKKLLGIDLTDTTQDEQLKLLLPAAIDFATMWTNNPFATDEEGKTLLPAGIKPAISSMISTIIHTRYDGIESESIGPMSQNFRNPTELWSDSSGGVNRAPWFAMLKPYRRFSFVPAKSPFAR